MSGKTRFLRYHTTTNVRRLIKHGKRNTSDLASVAAVVSLLIEMRKVAEAAALTGEDLQVCIDAAMQTCNIEAVDDPMGGETFRYKA